MCAPRVWHDKCARKDSGTVLFQFGRPHKAGRKDDLTMRQNSHQPNRWKGFTLGIAGGVAGVFAMQCYWQAVMSLTGDDPRKQTTGPGPHPLDDISLVGT